MSNYIVERAAAFGQHRAQVLPTGNELCLRVEDDFHVPGAPYLAGTVQRVTHPDCRCVTGAVHD
ncbi:hypothetical protein GCM10009085_35110 [Pseudomonas avellanae]|nr:hypothetical protein GCM10009085_35110 [Pseudomonas avellanae]